MAAARVTLESAWMHSSHSASMSASVSTGRTYARPPWPAQPARAASPHTHHSSHSVGAGARQPCSARLVWIMHGRQAGNGVQGYEYGLLCRSCCHLLRAPHAEACMGARARRAHTSSVQQRSVQQRSSAAGSSAACSSAACSSQASSGWHVSCMHVRAYRRRHRAGCSRRPRCGCEPRWT
jgi:hypothetical protein